MGLVEERGNWGSGMDLVDEEGEGEQGVAWGLDIVLAEEGKGCGIHGRRKRTWKKEKNMEEGKEHGRRKRREL